MKTITNTEIIKLQAEDKKLLFIGFDGSEEFYQEMGKTGGWSFMGLRPATEKELRQQARETDIEEYCTIPLFLSKYIDYNAFADDMEADWKDNVDVKTTREEQKETIYLGFGSGTDAKNYFKKNKINTYEEYCTHFEYVGLNEKEFKSFVKTYCK